MSINLYDSLERKLKELKPAQADGIFRFYNCGPTVYAPAHIGNFRTFVINDVIRRLLELEYPGKVKHVRNLTDVDDRTIGQTQKEKLPLATITKKWTDIFHADCDALNCLRPHHEPTATGYIREQVNMIEVLMEKGNAYRAADGSVYFKVSSFDGYGKLSRVKERELLVTDATADSDHKNSVSDFALWKAYKPAEDGDVKWAGPRGAGEGRPGWHIECSAMSKALLGDTIDLHTGGEDLEFPHHENEIAQSECCNGVPFARHWFHSKHLLVDGTTMSKSKGNYYTLGDLTAKGYSAMAVRYALLNGDPKKQLNFVLENMQGYETRLDYILKKIKDLGRIGNVLFVKKERDQILASDSKDEWGSFKGAWDALCDQVNVPLCLGLAANAFKELVDRDIRQELPEDKARLEFLAAVRLFQKALGFKLDLETVEEEQAKAGPEIPHKIRLLAEERWVAKQAKDFAGADALRKELAALGWSMLDGKDGYKLEPLKK